MCKSYPLPKSVDELEYTSMCWPALANLWTCKIASSWRKTVCCSLICSCSKKKWPKPLPPRLLHQAHPPPPLLSPSRPTPPHLRPRLGRENGVFHGSTSATPTPLLNPLKPPKSSRESKLILRLRSIFRRTSWKRQGNADSLLAMADSLAVRPLLTLSVGISLRVGASTHHT